FLLALTLKYRWKSLTFFWALSLATALAVYKISGDLCRGWDETTFLYSCLVSVYFIVFFISGIMLALERERAAILFTRIPAWAKYGLAALVLAGFLKVDAQGDANFLSIFVDYLHGFSAAGLILLLIGSKPAARFFE